MGELIPAEAPALMFRSFVDAVGKDVALRGFGRLTCPLPTEKVWEWHEDELAGFGTLVYHPFGRVETTVGVWPQWQQRGLRDRIRRALIDLAFADPSVHAVVAEALLVNAAQAIRMLQEAVEGRGPFRFNGVLLEPQPRLQFIQTRADWESRGPQPGESFVEPTTTGVVEKTER